MKRIAITTSMLTALVVMTLIIYSFAESNVTIPTVMGHDNTIKIMTFNIWNDGRRNPLSDTANVIRAAGAHVVGLQESREATQSLAELLGWKYYLQHNSGTAVLSQWEIIGSTSPSSLGVEIRRPIYADDNRTIVDSFVFYVLNMHLSHCPYEPYQLLDIPYCGAPVLDKTETAAIASAKAARGRDVEAILLEVDSIIDKHTTPPLIFVTGDFNEPSFRDWTKDTAIAGRHPLIVEWPTTAALEAARPTTLKASLSFVDTYRDTHPDVMAYPGYSWTPKTSEDDPDDHHDRIDFVFFSTYSYQGNATADIEIKLVHTEIIGEDQAVSDIVVNPYPSDHRAMVATFELLLNSKTLHEEETSKDGEIDVETTEEELTVTTNLPSIDAASEAVRTAMTTGTWILYGAVLLWAL